MLSKPDSEIVTQISPSLCRHLCWPLLSSYSPRGKSAGPCCCRGHCWGGWRRWCRPPTQPSRLGRAAQTSLLLLPGPWAWPGSLPSGQLWAKSAWVGGPRGWGRRGAGREGQGGESVSLTEGVRIIEMKTWKRKRPVSECEKCCEAGERSEGRHGLCAGGWEGQSEGEAADTGMGGECGANRKWNGEGFCTRTPSFIMFS